MEGLVRYVSSFSTGSFKPLAIASSVSRRGACSPLSILASVTRPMPADRPNAFCVNPALVRASLMRSPRIRLSSWAPAFDSHM